MEGDPSMCVYVRACVRACACVCVKSFQVTSDLWQHCEFMPFGSWQRDKLLPSERGKFGLAQRGPKEARNSKLLLRSSSLYLVDPDKGKDLFLQEFNP